MENLMAMNCTGPVYKKNVLSVCSGIFGLNEGVGPGDTTPLDYKKYATTMDDSITAAINPSNIMLSTDPIAIEMQCIKMMRINNGGNYDVNSLPPYLQACAGITGKMSGTVYNIGKINEEKEEDGKPKIRTIINEVIMTDLTAPARYRARQDGISVSMAPGHATFIEFSLPGERVGRTASIEIYGIDGRLTHQRKLRILGERSRFSWDNSGMNGAAVGPGAYIVRIACGDVRMSTQFTLLF